MTSAVACPHCGQHIAQDARLAGHVVQCPHCGGQLQLPRLPTAQARQAAVSPDEGLDFADSSASPIVRSRKRRPRSGWGVAVFSALGVLLVGGLVALVIFLTKKPGTQERPFVVTADDLLAEFADNEVAFRRKYEGFLIEVTGYREMDNHARDTISLVGEREHRLNLQGKGDLAEDRRILCIFPRKVSPKTGSVLTIRGRCEAGTLTLSDCSIVDRDRPYRPLGTGAERAKARNNDGPHGGLTARTLSAKRKEICDKFPQQGFLVNAEWIKTYRDQVLEVTGIIERIGAGGERDKAGPGGPIIFLKGDEGWVEFVDRPVAEGGRYTREGVSDIECRFGPQSEAALAKLHAGQAIKIRGTFDASSSTVVVLRECSLVE